MSYEDQLIREMTQDQGPLEQDAESPNESTETGDAKRGYWRQNTYEGHPHSYTLVCGQDIQDFPTYGKLCAHCRKNNIVAQLA